MDKRRAIQIMTKAAQLYKEHLEDQKVLFLYGLISNYRKVIRFCHLYRDMKLFSIDTIFYI